MTGKDDECPECEDAAKAGVACPLCLAPAPAQAVHDVEATHTPAPVWDMAPRGDA